jgi:hypothetical protein
MESIRTYLKGKKTYVLGGVAIIGSLASYMVGDISLTEAAGAIWAGITAMTLRAGIKTEVSK